MPKLPIVSGPQARRALEKAGFSFIRQRGSHMVLSNGTATVVVPNHHQLARGTLRSILCRSGIAPVRFVHLLRS